MNTEFYASKDIRRCSTYSTQILEFIRAAGNHGATRRELFASGPFWRRASSNEHLQVLSGLERLGLIREALPKTGPRVYFAT